MGTKDSLPDLDETGLVRRKRAPSSRIRPPVLRSRPYVYVKIRAGGLPTTVRIPKELFDRLVLSCGGVVEARKRVRMVAQTAPDEEANRSGWTTDRLNAFLSDVPIVRRRSLAKGVGQLELL